MPERDAIAKQSSRDLSGWAYLLMMLTGIWIIVSLATSDWNTYRVLDEQGWIEHNHDTPVWIEGEWLTGEYRICQMPGPTWGKLPDYAHLLCGKGLQNADDGIWPAGFRYRLSDQEFAALFGTVSHWDIVEHYFHVLPVQYWGMIDRTGRATFSWSCQKQERGIECKALN